MFMDCLDEVDREEGEDTEESVRRKKDPTHGGGGGGFLRY